jgi:thiol-disulfide isomerase/thioredoxin
MHKKIFSNPRLRCYNGNMKISDDMNCPPVELNLRLEAGKKTAVLFVEPWCPFCHQFLPEFIEFAAEENGRFRCLTVRLENGDDPLYEKFAIEVVPTVILFDGTVPVSRLDGVLGVGLDPEDLRRLSKEEPA